MSKLIASLGLNLQFTFATADRAKQDSFCSSTPVHFIEVGRSACGRLHISVIQTFCEMVCDAIEACPETPIVLCMEDENFTTKRNACTLCGAYLLLFEDSDIHRVTEEFANASGQGGSHACRYITDDVLSCWRALERARALRWLGPQADGGDPVLDVEMAAHYARPANGGVHVLVPGRLLLSPPPHALPPGEDWADPPEPAAPGRAGGRVFAAGFLADLLADLGATAAVCLGRADEGDAAALRERGLDVHGLGLAGRRPALLGAMDRLLSVSRAAAPGAVALFPPRAAAPGGGGECATAAVAGWVETLATALLMTECGFGGGAAAAWVRMVCPDLPEAAGPGRAPGP